MLPIANRLSARAKGWGNFFARADDSQGFLAVWQLCSQQAPSVDFEVFLQAGRPISLMPGSENWGNSHAQPGLLVFVGKNRKTSGASFEAVRKGKSALL